MTYGRMFTEASGVPALVYLWELFEEGNDEPLFAARRPQARWAFESGVWEEQAVELAKANPAKLFWTRDGQRFEETVELRFS